MQAEKDGWAIVSVSGEMDLVTSPAVRQQVHDAVAAGQRHIVLDLAEVRFCDSSGVGVLIAARRLVRSCAGRLRLILPAEGVVSPAGGPLPAYGGGIPARAEGYAGGFHVNRVLAALGVRRLFEVFPDLAAATDEAGSPLSA
jgi:anti-anti-sigma factor